MLFLILLAVVWSVLCSIIQQTTCVRLSNVCLFVYMPINNILVEMVSQDESRKLLMEDPVQETASQRFECPCMHSLWYHVDDYHSTWWKKLPCWARKASGDVEENPGSADYPLPTISTEIKVEDGHSHTQHGNLDGFSRKWPTSWFWQLLVLTVRTFRQSRHVILSKLNFTQTIVLAVIVSVIWFQVPDDERSVNDRHGYVSGILFQQCVFYKYCVIAVLLRLHFLGLPTIDSCYLVM